MTTRAMAVRERGPLKSKWQFTVAETAKRLSLSENVVEKETAKGLNLILRTLAEQPLLTATVPHNTAGVRHVAD